MEYHHIIFVAIVCTAPGTIGELTNSSTIATPIAATKIHDESQFNAFMADMWLEGSNILRVLWIECSRKLNFESADISKADYLTNIWHCMKRKSLKALDRSLSADVLPVASGLNLVRYEMVNHQGQVVRSANGSNLDNSSWSDEMLEDGDWRGLVLNRMTKVFNTHVLKLDIDSEGNPRVEEKTELRHRRRHQMMHMMMFGIMCMGMIVVPMGFQFLAVLGGKALVLAKLALILSSIQGLKKVATSPLNYGLYSSYPTPYEHFEKRGHGGSQLRAPPAPPTPPIHQAPTPAQFQDYPEDRGDSSYERIKYRYDNEARTWKPELPRALKKSLYNMLEAPKVFPVYAAPPSGFDPGTSFSSSGRGSILPVATPSPMLIGTGPTDLHAEYTIDLPVNKVQFKSNAPFITS